MGLNLRRDVHLGCRSREPVRAGSLSDVAANKSSSSSNSMSSEGRGFYRPLFVRCKTLLAATFKVRGRKEGIFLVFAAALALVSCNNDKIEVYRIPKEGVTVAMQNGSAGLPPAPASNPAKWVKPEGWSEQPLSEMRLGSFKVDGSNAASADVSVTAFPGDAGGLAPNVNRWRGQLQLPPLEEDQLQQTIQRTEVEGVQTYLVDIQTPDNAAKPSRILGALLETPDRTWFVKMTGSPELIESQRQKFFDFVKSFRFTSAIEGQVPETAGANMPKSTNDK
jgi:hypothetical protein